MPCLVRIAVVSMVAIGCGKSTEPAKKVTRAQCIAVRDHVVDLIIEYYLRHAPETFDGLDRTDAAVMVALPPGVKRETFGPFLASEAGAPWLANARARLVAGTGLTDIVERCTKRAKPEHTACWLGATTMEIFQQCPLP